MATRCKSQQGTCTLNSWILAAVGYHAGMRKAAAALKLFCAQPLKHSRSLSDHPLSVFLL